MHSGCGSPYWVRAEEGGLRADLWLPDDEPAHTGQVQPYDGGGKGKTIAFQR